ncbi:MAG TPA: DUF3634 family protein [Polyangiaceae bacterium]|jgi:hypothetical protein|nr:DUF3634 family protein [Polyangiaceae bacterium]
MRYLVFAALSVIAWLVIRRANELCAVTLTKDGARLVRGRAPAALLSDFTEIARRASRTETTVRVVLESGSPRLLAPADLDETTVQQLRNVVGQHPVVHFRTGRRV